MTVAPRDLLDLRHSITLLSGVTDAKALGITGDDAHGKGYHLGVATIKSLGNYPNNDWSTEQTRDRVGGDTASAMDVTLSWPNGGKAAAQRWTWAVAAAVKAGQLPYVSEINWQNQQGQKRRYTVHDGREVASTDTVDIHTHIGFWRNTEGTRNFTSMLSLMASAIGGTPVADWTQAQINAAMWQLTDNPAGPLHARVNTVLIKLDTLLTAVTGGNASMISDIVTGVLQGLADDPNTSITQGDIDHIAEAVRTKFSTTPLS